MSIEKNSLYSLLLIKFQQIALVRKYTHIRSSTVKFLLRVSAVIEPSSGRCVLRDYT
jgi:hypothetical protein